MQTRFRLPILVLMTALVIFSSCSKKTNKEGRYIPENAAVVFIMNGESVSSKLPWEEIKQNGMFKGVDSSLKLDEFSKAAFDNPEVTGIDTKKKFLLFFEKDSLGGYLAFEGPVKDAAKFKDFNTKMHKAAAQSEKNGIQFLADDKMTMSWDKEKFVILVDMPQFNGRKGFGEGSSRVGKRDVINTITGIYELSESKSMGSNEKFSELVSEKADIHFWMNIGSFTEDNPAMSTLSMTKISQLYEGYCMGGIANFDNGKINVDIRSYAGKELSDLYKKYSGSKINDEMVKRIPAQDLAALIAVSFKPEAVKEFVKLTGMDGLLNMSMANLGFTVDDCVKALKGDLVFAISDIKKDSIGKPEMNALFAASIADKNSFTKLMEAINNLKKSKFGPDADKFFSYKSNDKLFAAASKMETVDKYLGSTNNNNNTNILQEIGGAASAVYVNFQTIMKAWGNDSKDSIDNLIYQAAVKTWDNAIATGEGFENGASHTHIEINLVDKNTNSLKQLNSFIGTMGSLQQQKKLARDKWINDNLSADSSMTVSPVPGGN